MFWLKQKECPYTFPLACCAVANQGLSNGTVAQLCDHVFLFFFVCAPPPFRSFWSLHFSSHLPKIVNVFVFWGARKGGSSPRFKKCAFTSGAKTLNPPFFVRTKTATDLHGQHDKTCTTARANQFWVPPPFAPLGSRTTPSVSAAPPHELPTSTTKPRQPVHHNLQSATVGGQALGNPSPARSSSWSPSSCLSAIASRGTLECKSELPKCPCSVA